MSQRPRTAVLEPTSTGLDHLALKSVRAHADLRGPLMTMRVEQHFVNPGHEEAEIVYTFPIPWKAVLLGVVVRLAGRILKGTVVERAAAALGYEEALAQGDSAILLQTNSDGSYTVNLGSLRPGEACQIDLEYAQVVQFEAGCLRLTVPTTIAPRYGDPTSEGGFEPHQVPQHSGFAEYPFEMTVSLHSALAGAAVSSPTHPIRVEPGAQTCTVSLARTGALDRDFVLKVEGAFGESVALVAPDPVTGGQAAMATICPRIEGNALPVTLKVLVDCSGSMAGDSITAARRALQALVEQLDTHDSFSLSKFGDEVRHRSRATWKVTEATRLAASRWTSELQANMGGTEIEAALRQVCELPARGTPSVLLVTDGEIHAVDRLIVFARDAGHRIFVVGIGSSPTEHHLRRVAQETGGACEFVVPGEAVANAISRMFERMRAPCVTDLRVQWPFECAWSSPVPKALFPGDVFTLFAQPAQGARVAPHAAAQVWGQQGREDQLIGSAALRADPQASTLHRIAALDRIGTLDTADTQATQIAIAYQLVTRNTSFLLVHERVEEQKSTGMPALIKVAQMLAAGWGGIGSVTPPRRLQGMDTRMGLAPYDMSVGAVASVHASRRASVNDIAPMFLRKSSRLSAFVDALDDISDSPLTSVASPLELQQWLRDVPHDKWPSSLHSLRTLVGDEVCDWLEFVFERGDATEPALVEAFFLAVAEGDLGQGAQPPGFFKSLLRTGSSLQSRMAGSLKGMEPHAWPQSITGILLDAQPRTSRPEV